ncbi:MAG: hypothetical protein JST54_09645 [Deltaproteobacteria bacterium]|nr:hypothetical protein [Deltaproteobacteria bacterium]
MNARAHMQKQHFELTPPRPPSLRFLTAAMVLMAAQLCACGGECRGDRDCPASQSCLETSSDAQVRTCCAEADVCAGTCCAADETCELGTCVGSTGAAPAPASDGSGDVSDCGFDCGSAATDEGTAASDDDGNADPNSDPSTTGTSGDDSGGGTSGTT